MALTATDYFSGAAACDFEAEASFYASLKMRNGTFKLTRPNRFAEVETAIADIVDAYAGRLRDVLDIGVSTGVTTLEFAAYLRDHRANAHVIGTDLFIDAHIVYPHRALAVLCDAAGWPLQYEWQGRVIRPWIRRLDYFTLAAPLRGAAQWIIGRMARRMIKAGRTTPVKMITRHRRIDLPVQFIENDILKPAPQLRGRFDFIRAANILNLGYFTESQITTALTNIRAYLRGTNALFLVTRTGEEGRNDGTLFELAPTGRMQALRRIGRGSEIEHLVVAQGGSS